MAEPDRLAAALRYQQELEEAQRPATMNPNMAAQGVGSRNRFAAALPSQSGNWSGEALPMESRATFLPFQDTLPGSVMNKRSLALPGIVAGAVNAFTAPGRAYSGSDPTFNPQEEAANFAMNVMGGGIGASRVAPAPAGSLGMNVIGPKKQALIDAGFYHPIGGGKKLPMPVGDMKFTAVENVPKVDQRVISPESMQGGTLVPAIGDRTAAGAMLYDVGGHPLTSPVQLEGGADFMRTHAPYGSAWASDKGVITALSKKVREAGERGDVYMPHVAMSHTSGDFSKMMSDALLEQMKSSTISKTAKLEFDRNMRRVRPEWKGIDHPKALDQLNSNGAVRTAFVAEANLDQFANRGFPNVAQTRVAITDPNLMNVPMHSSGYTVAKMNPEGLVISNPVAPHSTYSTQLGGQYAGGFAQPVPRDIMFPDFYSGRRAMSGDPAGDVRSFQLSNPIQKADQKWLDGVMKYLEEAKD
jgi:hypothetical protein